MCIKNKINSQQLELQSVCKFAAQIIMSFIRISMCVNIAQIRMSLWVISKFRKTSYRINENCLLENNFPIEDVNFVIVVHRNFRKMPAIFMMTGISLLTTNHYVITYVIG